jgi:hypothetical protein
MNNYLIIGIVISIICLLIFNSDILKFDFLNYEIRQKSKKNSESFLDYDSDSQTENSKNNKKKKNLDDTEISFDDSSDKSKIFSNKDNNKKLLDNIKKMMINMKNKNENSRDLRRDKNRDLRRDNRRDSRNNNRRDIGNKKENEIAEMHRLAQQLSRKNNNNNQIEKEQINHQSDNTNYDLTDTISGIINNELNNL